MTSSSTITLGFVAAAATAGVLTTPACDGEFRFDEHGLRDAAGLDSGDAQRVDTPGGACTDDDVCAGLGLRCKTDARRCVACLHDEDCTSSAGRRCEPERNVCVTCLDAQDCGPRQRCESVTRRCIDVCAEGDEQCPPGLVCQESESRCIECRTSSHCAGSPKGSRCDPANGACVECAGNADCPTARPTCDRHSGRCVGCVTWAECPADAACDPREHVCRRVPLL